MNQPLRLLLLEDSVDDADLILRELRKEGWDFEARRVENERDYRQQLEAFCPDLILSDYNLPTYNGRSALALAQQQAPHIPFIFVSGVMGEETAIEALKQGATDYILKDGLVRLRTAVRRALQEAAEHQKRLEAEKQIRYQANLLQNVSDAIVSTDPNFVIRTWNKAAENLYGWSAAEVIGHPFPQVVPTRYPENNREEVLRHFREDGFWKGEVFQAHRNGAELSILSAATWIKDSEGQTTGVVVVNRDMTAHRRTEKSLKESQELYRAIITCSPFPILGLDLDGTILTWNEAAESVFGWSAVEIIGQPNPIVPSDKRAEFDALRERVYREGSVTGVEIARMNKYGERLDFSLSAASIRDAQGQIIGMMATFDNITERKRVEGERAELLVQQQMAEREQAAQRQRLQQILDTVPDGVVLLDASGRVTLANPAGQALLQRLSGAAVGETITRLGDLPFADPTSTPYDAWHALQYEDGHFELLIRPIALETQDGDSVLLLRDVTAEYEQEQYMEVQQRLATVGQLAAGIAHDFNNVMAVIMLYVQLLQKTAVLTPNERNKLDTVYKQAQHASDMITQILDFSRKSVIERVPLDLLPLFKEMVKLLNSTLPETIQIEMTSAPGDFIALADPTRLRQALMNIILNARDAMPGGGRLRLELSQFCLNPEQIAPLPDLEPGHWLQISIHDEGVGINQEHLPRIFDPFFTTKEPGKGTGLGLAQVYGIVKQHGGSIGAESRLGDGSTFTIYLPAFTAPTSPELPSYDRDHLLPGAETILVVEDNDTMRTSVADALSVLGYRVLEARDGAEALRMLASQNDRIDLVLSDVVMPEMGGGDLHQRIRQQYPTLPLLLMTGYPLGEHAPELAGLPWISKPFTIHTLAGKIHSLLHTIT